MFGGDINPRITRLAFRRRVVLSWMARSFRSFGNPGWLAAAFFVQTLSSYAAAAENVIPSMLTNTADIRALKPAEIERGRTVRLDGIVTYCYLPWQMLFIQDTQGGCYVVPTGISQELAEGTWIRLDGTVAAGVNGPIIVGPKIQLLPSVAEGRVSPKPRRVGLTEFAARPEDAQWVETVGVVRRVQGGESKWWLEIGNSVANVAVQMMANEHVPTPYEWLNAVVRVRGVCSLSVVDKISKVTLHASTIEDITVEEPSPTELFQATPLELAALPERLVDATNSHRVRVLGQVLHVGSASQLFVGDSQWGIRVEGVGLAGFAVGDELEASGFVTWNDGSWELAHSETRKVGSATPVAPMILTDTQLLPTGQRMSLIEVGGKLLEWESNSSSSYFTISRPATGEVLTVEIDEPALSIRAGWQRGTIVQVSGLWLTRRFRDRSNVLLCRSGADFQVVRLPSWWTPRRVFIGFVSIGGSGLLLGLWSLTLHYRVRQQSRQIRQTLQQEAALERRFRELFERANNAVLTLESDGTLVDLNAAAVRIFGESRSSLLGRRLDESIAAVDRQKFWDCLFERGEKTESQTIEVRLCNPQGLPRVLEITSCLRQDEAARPVIQLIAHDISERKQAEAKMVRMNQEFAKLSRSAGMAEVATSVLHNVGNVLNSVNVSANLIDDQLRRSKTIFLSKAAKLLNEHKDHLADYLVNDPKGKKLPTFIESLADQIMQEQDLLAAEAHSLQQNVEHIKQIVAMQQSHATIAGVSEILLVSELVEEALKMVSSGLARHRIEIIREFEAVLPILADRHKVLQILINLIGNAKHALEHRADGRRLSIRILGSQATLVRVEVQDNGLGVPLENLSRIFNHGFTTKASGHGFGLHSGANAAKEMGGSLQVRSDGLGTGATFILELPNQIPLPSRA